MKAGIFIDYIWIADTNKPLSEAHWKFLPENWTEDIRKYRKTGDQVRNWAGKFLLWNFLTENQLQQLAPSLKGDEMGRPFIEHALDFNITHSGQLVACIFSFHQRVGMDVEKVREINIPDFHKQFSPPEMQWIVMQPDSRRAFFDAWTQKEAVMKADGRGMRIPLHDIRLQGNFATIEGRSEKWNLQKMNLFEGYGTHICSPDAFQELLVRQLNFPENPIFEKP